MNKHDGSACAVHVFKNINLLKLRDKCNNPSKVVQYLKFVYTGWKDGTCY